MHKKGLTLLEILVTVVLIGISLLALASLVTSGKHLLKFTENDAQALSLALAKKEELLSRSFTHPDLCSGCHQQGTEDTIFDWNTTVTENSLCNATTGRCVPYKEINVSVEYPEETISGRNADKRRQVTVRDIVPYPFVHIANANSGVTPCDTAFNNNCQVFFENAHGNPLWTVVAGPFGPDNDLKIELPAYSVRKDFLVMYDIAIKIENPTGLRPTHSILTRARRYRTNNPAIEAFGVPTTQTPILSQGSISNIIKFDNVPANIPHTVEIQWRKNTSQGIISVERSSLVVIAVED